MSNISEAAKAEWVTQYVDDADRLDYCLSLDIPDEASTEAWIETTEHFAAEMADLALRLDRFDVALTPTTFAWAHEYMRRHTKPTARKEGE